MPFLRVPRLGETPGRGKGNPSRLVAHARLGALFGGLLGAFFVAPLLSHATEAALLAAAILLAVAAAAAAGYEVWRVRAERRGPAVAAAAGALTTGALWTFLAWLVSGEPSLRLGTPLALFEDATGSLAVAAVIDGALALVVVAATGLVVLDATAELDRGGIRPVRALGPLLQPSLRNAAAVAGAGLASPGLLVAEWAREVAGRVTSLARRRARAVFHLDVAPDALARVVAPLELTGLRVARRRLLLPDAAHGAFVVATGPADAVERFAEMLEGDLLLTGIFAWSREAVRAERRVNALAAEGEGAVTLEERAALLEEAGSLARLLAARSFVEEERSLLVGWKAQALVLRLHERAAAGGGRRGDGREVAPGPYLAPALGPLVEAGGLAAAADAVYLPWWILPLRTPEGEVEVAVDAVTPVPSTKAGAAVLAELERRGPRHLLPPATRPHFVPPAPLDDAVAAVEPLVPRGAVRKELAQLVYVPYLPTKDGSVNLLTGEEGPPVPLLPKGKLPAGTLVS